MSGSNPRSPSRSRSFAAAADLLPAAARELPGGLVPPSLSLRLGDGGIALLPATVGRQTRVTRDRHAQGFGLHEAVHQRGGGATNVVISARPTALAALGLRGQTVARCLLELPCAELVSPPDGDLVDAVASFVGSDVRAVLLGMGRFGVVSWADDLARAVADLVHIARAAEATLCASPGAAQLSEREVTRWREQLDAEAPVCCVRCNACPNGLLPAPGRSVAEGATQAALESAVEDLLRAG